jgi:hypothetical protein
MQRKFITFAQVQQSARAAGLPVAKHEGDGIYFVPSATAPATGYTVVLSNAGPVCSCPDGGRRCWHGARAAELAGQVAAATEAARKAAVIAKGDAAAADLFGRRKAVAA